MSPLSRRSLLARAGGTAFALSGAGAVLNACGSSDEPSATPAGKGEGIGGIPVATKASPVTLPLFDDNVAIKSGLKPEGGPLVILDWGDYLSPDVLSSFEAKYGVETKVSKYSTFQESLGKVTSGAVKADVWVPVVERLPQLVAAKLIQPLNQDYIPNLGNVLPALANPYYDQGSQYTIPNYIWTTGILWRGDLLPDLDPASADNPWDVFWSTPEAKGKMGLQNAEVFDPLSLGFLRNGVTDFPAITKKQLDKAVADLQQLTKAGTKFHYTAFQAVANGTEILSQAWNGDAFLAPGYLRKSAPADSIKFWFPEDGVGSVNSDYWCVPKNAEHPVLGHLFINHFLQGEMALANYTGVGYQQPLNDLTVDYLVKNGAGDEALMDMVYVTPEAAENGLPNPTPTAEQLKWYEAAFATLSSGTS
ncbi:MAG: spermidine/putrescine transport system substrate-binding protein [Thermoleophilaceae bacterium]|jgi:spermidine/putrescine transport system substrate-binding protein|nr:spermidine/putrescine transport system substrate-binding protein [Thermoleophilaceae bacterium]